MTPPLTWAEHRARILALPVVEPVADEDDRDPDEVAALFASLSGIGDTRAWDEQCRHVERVESRSAYQREQRQCTVTVPLAQRRRLELERAGQVTLGVVSREHVVRYSCGGMPENERQRARERQARDNDAYREREAKRKADVRAKARRREVEALEGAGQRRLVG